MPSKRKFVKSLPILLPLMVAIFQPVQAGDLSTLFTTPAERQLINSNRYKSDDGQITQAVETETEPDPVQQLIQEDVTVTREYRVSGITVSSDGPHTVWINAIAYEDGEQLEDKSKIKVLVGDQIGVRITTPDGKYHYATSGELIEVTYLVPSDN